MKKNKELKIENNSSWVYFLFLTAVTILANSLSTYTFKISDCVLNYSVFFIPFFFFIISYISNKFDYKNAFIGIAIASLLAFSFSVIVSFALGRRIDFYGHLLQIIPFLGSGIVNLLISYFIGNKSNIFIIFLRYLLAIVVYFSIFTIINIEEAVVDSYWIKYFINIGIDAVIAFILTLISKIKM